MIMIFLTWLGLGLFPPMLCGLLVLITTQHNLLAGLAWTTSNAIWLAFLGTKGSKL